MTARVGGAQDLIVRVAAVTFIGILVGCITARPAMNTTPPASSTTPR